MRLESAREQLHDAAVQTSAHPGAGPRRNACSRRLQACGCPAAGLGPRGHACGGPAPVAVPCGTWVAGSHRPRPARAVHHGWRAGLPSGPLGLLSDARGTWPGAWPARACGAVDAARERLELIHAADEAQAVAQPRHRRAGRRNRALRTRDRRGRMLPCRWRAPRRVRRRGSAREARARCAAAGAPCCRSLRQARAGMRASAHARAGSARAHGGWMPARARQPAERSPPGAHGLCPPAPRSRHPQQQRPRPGPAWRSPALPLGLGKGRACRTSSANCGSASAPRRCATVVSSPRADATRRGPVCSSTKQPVPYVLFAVPGPQRWPSTAACWSPRQPAGRAVGS